MPDPTPEAVIELARKVWPHAGCRLTATYTHDQDTVVYVTWELICFTIGSGLQKFDAPTLAELYAKLQVMEEGQQ